MPGSMPMTEEPRRAIWLPLTLTWTMSPVAARSRTTRAVMILVTLAGASRSWAFTAHRGEPQERSLTIHARAVTGGGGAVGSMGGPMSGWPSETALYDEPSEAAGPLCVSLSGRAREVLLP